MHGGTMEQGLIKVGSSFLVTVQDHASGQRIDKFITQHFEQYSSRSFLQKLFDQKQQYI